MAFYSEAGSNKIDIYLLKFNANDSDYLKYGFGRVKAWWYQIKLGLGGLWLYMVKR